jgi:uncharacterized protein
MIDAVAQRLQVVHSSLGRLRIHLPDPTGQITARLRRLPGVTYAEANRITGNLLILFSSPQTTEKTLLAELQSCCAIAPVASPSIPKSRPTQAVVVRKAVKQIEIATVKIERRTADVVRPPVYLTGWRSWLYKAFGWASVGLAVVGAITPGIPTVPFVILAGYFFVRSSPEAHQWLLRSRWFGQMLRDWEEYRGVRRSVKYAVVGLLAAGLAIAWLLGLSPVVIGSILTFGVIGVVVVLRLPAVEAPRLAH